MNKDLSLIACALMTWGIGEGMFMFFQPLYLQQLGASPVAIGTILGFFGASMAIAHIPAGYISDRIGRRPLLWLSWVIGTGATIIMALAPSLPWFIGGMFLYGLTSFVMSPLASYVTVARGKLGVSRALTLIMAFYNGGAIIGPLLGGVIGDKLGLHQIYAISSIIFVLSTLIIFFISSQPVEPVPVHETGNKPPVNTKFISFLIIVFLAMFAMTLPQPLSSNFLQNERGLNLSQIGILGTTSSIGVVILNLILGQMNVRVSYVLCQVSVMIYSTTLWLSHNMIWYLLGFFLSGGNRVARTLAPAQTRRLIHQTNMGFAYGITEAIGTSVMLPAAWLAGNLYRINPSLMYILSSGLLILTITASALFLPRETSN